ncbi:hypothetical protein T484DRAFT_1632947 [Baffinella frigidus]|nr:hypothetical protein T484DRAFT_1632947 [Cryptophyta sp. CCMP2293]
MIIGIPHPTPHSPGRNTSISGLLKSIFRNKFKYFFLTLNPQPSPPANSMARSTRTAMSTRPPTPCNPCTLQPYTLNHKPEARSPEPETRNPKPYTLNPTPSTINPKPETRSPEPHTLNPTP